MKENQSLVKDLSDFVAELTLLLDPLQAQLDVLNSLAKAAKNAVEANPLQAATKEREMTRDGLTRLQERARSLQELVRSLVLLRKKTLTATTAVPTEQHGNVVPPGTACAEDGTRDKNAGQAGRADRTAEPLGKLLPACESIETHTRALLICRARKILVFTVVTVVFLPLSFFTSYFGKSKKK